MFCRAVPILVEGVLSAATKQCPCHVPISQRKGSKSSSSTTSRRSESSAPSISEPAAAAWPRRAMASPLSRSSTGRRAVRSDPDRPASSGCGRPGRSAGARAASPSTQVVIITGYASLDSAITAVRLGAYDYLTKPFSLGQIDVVMARVTGSRSRKRIARPCVG